MGYPPQQQPHYQPVRWQYMILQKIRNPEARLNELGAQGWELCGLDNDPKAQLIESTRYVLKRPY